VHRSLIVARMNPADADAVAGIFARSDATELPRIVGVSRRTLFRFHDLYFHLVEADDDITPSLYQARTHPLYQDINTELGRYVRPYDPNWREPRDAMATLFYVWESGDNGA
jgi:cyclase